ncbi:MAG: hypothetical protein HY900_04495 [Deltaproteobacteria bacterium]|nr:hypothetical protein [Deltaproteobacteria bacterium]
MKGNEEFGLASWIEAQTRLAGAWSEAARRLASGLAPGASDEGPERTPLGEAGEGWLRWYGEALRAAVAGASLWGLGAQASEEDGTAKPSEAWAQELEGLRSACAEFAARAQASSPLTAGAAGPGGPAAAVVAALQGQLAKLCGRPAFGFTREFQEKAAGVLNAWVDLWQTQTEYLSELRNTATSALDRFDQKLSQKKEKGEIIQTPAELLELWSEAAEEGYFPVASDEKFAQAQARMTNSAMRYLQSSQSLLEDFYGTLGVPTRSDIDDAFLRIHEMRRQLRALRREVGHLRSELAEARAAASPAAGGAPPHARRARRTSREQTEATVS